MSRADAPESLRALTDGIVDAVALPALSAASPFIAGELLRSVSSRKRLQISCLVGLLDPLAAQACRVVDIGAGCGDLTRVASILWQKRAVGLESNAQRVTTANFRASGSDASFVQVDALKEKFDVDLGDFVIGLHACGALGDQLIGAACAARAKVGLVSCCLQKISQEHRQPLSERGKRAGLVLAKEILGLANVTSRQSGVEASMVETMQARTVRYALRLLLLSRGLAVEPGAEMRGINRRRAHRGLGDVATRALQLRGDAAPSEQEISQALARAQTEFGQIRRLSLPRSVMGRLVEVAVVLDRALHLVESGYEVAVGTAFDSEVSPRNTIILGKPCSAPSSSAYKIACGLSSDG
jgi:hypothetical protein